MESTEPPVQVDEDHMQYIFQAIWDRLKKVNNNNLYTHLQKRVQLIKSAQKASPGLPSQTAYCVLKKPPTSE